MKIQTGVFNFREVPQMAIWACFGDKCSLVRIEFSRHRLVGTVDSKNKERYKTKCVVNRRRLPLERRIAVKGLCRFEPCHLD